MCSSGMSAAASLSDKCLTCRRTLMDENESKEWSLGGQLAQGRSCGWIHRVDGLESTRGGLRGPGGSLGQAESSVAALRNIADSAQRSWSTNASRDLVDTHFDAMRRSSATLLTIVTSSSG